MGIVYLISHISSSAEVVNVYLLIIHLAVNGVIRSLYE